jgi:fibronectin-binding autotransporter adhesin
MLNKRMSWRKKSALAAVIAGAFAWQAPQASATNLYFTTGTAWHTAANWTTDSTGATVVGSAVPTASDLVQFNADNLTGPLTVTLNNPATALGLVFTNTGTTTLQSDTTTSRVLTLAGSGITINPGAGAVTIGNATNGTTVTLGTTQTWTNNGTLNLINGLAMGANPLIISGTGTTNLSTISGSVAIGTNALTINAGSTVNFTNTTNAATGGNTFTGNILINGGSLSAAMTGGFVTSPLGSQIGTTYRQMTLQAGGTFVSNATWNDNVPSATNVGIVFNFGAGGGKLDIASGTQLTLDDGTGTGTAAGNAQLQGSGDLTKLGLGTLSLGTGTTQSFANFTGAIFINQGTLLLGGGVNPLGATTAGTTIAPGAVFNLNGTTTAAAEPLTISGTGISGNNVLRNGSATATTFAGPITLAADSTIGSGAAGAMTLSGGITGAFNLTVNNTAAGGTTFSTTAVNNAGTFTNSGAGAGTTTIGLLGSLVTAINQTGTSPLTLTPVYPIAQFTTGQTITNSGAGLYTLTGGITGGTDLVFNANAAGGITVTGAINSGATTITNSGTGTGTVTLTAALPATVTNVTQTGSSPLTLTAAYPVAQLATGSTITNSGTGLYTLTGGITGATNPNFKANSTGGITVTAASTLTGTITSDGTGTGNVTLTAAIPATATNVLQNSPGTLTLTSAANAYTGTTTVTQGTLSFAGTPVTGTTSGLGNNSTNIILGGASTLGTLTYTGATATMTRGVTINAGGGQINSTAGVLTIQPGGVLTAAGLTIAPGGPLTFGGTNNISLGGPTATVPLISSTNPLNKVGTGTLTLNTLGGTAAIQSAMPINLQAGTLAIVPANNGTTATAAVLGTGLLTITPGATLAYGGSSTNVYTLTNAISIVNTAGTVNFTESSSTYTNSGTITVAAGASTPILRFNNGQSTSGAFIFNNAISGPADVQLNTTGSVSANMITLSGAQNQAGSISNVGATAGATATTLLSGTIGAGITAINQQGANPFTVSAAVPLSATLNTFTSTGAGAFNFTNASTFTGSQPLTFNPNSTGGIVVSGTNLNHTGTIINSGTGTGTTTISSVLGANVGNVIQNSATSPLVLSGTNSAYTGTYTITNGLLQFNSTAAMTGFTGTPNANVEISVGNGGILGLAYPTFTATNVSDLINNAGGTYANVSFASGSSLGLDTTAGNASFTNVLANPGASSIGLVKLGTNTLTLGTANTYTGPTSVRNGTLSVGSLNSVVGGVAASSLGAPTTALNGTVSLGSFTTAGGLSYTGAGETTDRVINLAGTTGGATIDQSGTGLLKFTSALTFTGVGTKTLTLSGSTAGTGEISGTIAGSYSTTATASPTPLTIAKSGTGTWTLSGTGNTVSTVIISGGVLDTGSAGLTVGNIGANILQSIGGNGTVTGKLIVAGVAGTNNGPDIGAQGTTTLDLTNLSIVDAIPATPIAYIDFYGGSATGVTLLSNTNTYAGISDISAGIFTVGTINSVTTNVGTGAVHTAASSLGSPTTIANGTLNLTSTLGATLRYTGAGETSDRAMVFTGATAGITTNLDQSGTGPLKFLGNITASGAATHILGLTGSTASTGELSGIISENSTTNTTAITKTGTGTWTLSGANTYTGATTVNGGKLILTTGTTNNSAVTVNNGSTLSIASNYTVGNALATAAGGKLTVSAGGILDLQNGAINTLTLSQGATFSGAALALNGGTLKFDIGATGDQISVTGPATATATSSGTNFIVINNLAGFAPGPYTLITANGGSLSNSNFALATNTINVGGTPYSLSLSGSATTEVLTVSTFVASDPAQAFWNGTTDAKWNTQAGGIGSGGATNWVAAAIGAPDTFSLPGANTNVTFTANSATNLSTTLEQAFTVNSLTFSGTGTANTAGSTITSGTGANTLTINAAAVNGNTLGNGITVNAGSGTNTITADVILGSNQTWTSNATTTTTVSSIVSELTSGLSLTKAGTGTIALTNNNTYSGSTSINGGVLSVPTLANGGAASGIGQSSNAAANLVFGGTGTLQYTGSNIVIDRNFTVNAGSTATFDVTQASTTLELSGATGAATTGLLTKVGAGALTLSGTNTYTGNTTVNAGKLNLSGSLVGIATSTVLQMTPAAGTNAIVNVSGGTSTLLGIKGANVNGAVSVYNQTGGTVNTVNAANSSTNNFVVQGVAGAYGMFNLTGGTFKVGTGTVGQGRLNLASASMTTGFAAGVAYIGGGGSPALLDQTNGEWYLPGYSLGQTTILTNGKFDRTGSNNPFGLVMDTAQVGGAYGVLNMAGGELLTGNSKSFVYGNSTTNGSGNTGFINLAAGVLTSGINISTSLPGAPVATNNLYVNYAGGTLKSSAALTQYTPTNNASLTSTSTVFGPINNSTVAGAPSFAGGAVFDTTGGDITIPAAMTLNGASGVGVQQADLTVTGGSGYVGAPAVQFSKGAAGVPAAGYALMSGGSVVGIVITEPGVYASGETPTITLTGGGATVPATIASGALTTNNANIGGVTKLGVNNLVISASNTFGGVIDIKGGMISIPTITNGGVAGPLGQSSNAASNLLLDSTTAGGGILRYTGTVAATTDRNFTLANTNGGFDASGTTLGTFTLTAANAMTVAPGLGAATLTLQGTGAGATGGGSIGTLIADGTGTTVGVTKAGAGAWAIGSSNNSYTGPTVITGGTLFVFKLDNGGSNSGIGASSNAASNLVLSGGGILSYTGIGATIDRNFTFGNTTTASGATIDVTNATGPLVISGNMTGVNTAAGTQVLTLTSLAASSANALNGNIVNSSGTSLTGITKTGVGAWTLGGTNTYSGATTLSAGTLQFAGSNALNGATPINIAGASTLQIRDDAATITHTANNLTVSSAGTVTIDVGNNGGATTGSTVAFGALNNGTAANALATVFNFTAANGYKQSYSSLALPGLTGNNTTLNPTSASVTITGNVTNQMSGAYTTNFDTLLLDGTTIGNQISGAISDATNFSVAVGKGDTRVTKQNTSTWTLAGVSTYHGPTSITNGTLVLAAGSGLGNTAISVTAGKNLSVLSGSGTITAGYGVDPLVTAAGASLNVAAGATFSMLDGGVGTFSLVQNSAFATAPLTLTSAILNLDLSSAGPDQIVQTGGTAGTAAAFSGINIVNFTTLGSSLTPGTYPLVTASGIIAGTTNANFKFSNGLSTDTLVAGAFTYPVSLVTVTGIEQLQIGAGFGNLTWTGQTNGNGATNSVWIEPGAGNNNFADTTPAVADYTVGSAVTFQDLNTITNANVTNGTVIVDAAGVNPGSVTVNNTAVDYIIQNASGTIGIAGTTGLTKSGTGKLTLSSANSYTGVTEINGGTLLVSNAGSLGVGGSITFGGGTLQYDTGITTDFSNRFVTGANQAVSIDTNGNNVSFAALLTSLGGTLTKSGAGILTLTNTAAAPSTYTGATVINGGTLKITGGTGSGSAGGVLSGTPTITVNNGGTLLLQAGFTGLSADLIGFTAGKEQLIINSGGTVLNNTAAPSTGNRQTLINTVLMTGGELGGTGPGAGGLNTGDANSGAFSWGNGTVAVQATSDAAGNPAVISANTSTQNVAIFQVNRGTGAVAPGAPDLLISGPITPYGAAGTNGITVRGSGILNLTGANTYKGNVTILGGTLGGIVNANSTQALGNNTAVLVMGDMTGLTGTLNVNQNNSVTGLTVNTTGATANMNTITIAAGKTLTNSGVTNVGNTATGSNNTLLTVAGTPTSTLTLGPVGGAAMTVGSTTGTGAPGALNSQLIVTGGTAVDVKLGVGALNVGFRNNGATVATVQATSATLDLSAAGNVSIVGSTNASTIFLGNNATTSAGNAFDVTTGTLKLSTAGTNTVTVGTMTLGTSVNQGAAAAQGFVVLGNAANNLNIDTIYVGKQKSIINGSTQNLINFAGTGGTLTLKGFAGGASKSALRIGYNDASGTGTITTGAVDLTGGSFNGQLSVLTVGFYLGTGGGGGKGTLSMGAGATTLDSLVLANRAGSTSLANNTGTLNLAGGSLTFNSGGTGITSNTTAATSGIATINLSGTGLLELANQPITIDGTGSAINMTGGTLSNVSTYSVNSSTNVTNAGALIQRTIAGTTTLGSIAFTGSTAALSVTAGTVSTTGISTTNAAASVTLDGGTLNVNGGNIGGATAVVTAFKSGTLQNVAEINNGAGLTKTTAGTLTLSGTQTYTGPTVVSAGTLIVNSNITTSSSVSVSGTGMLGGSGTTGAVTLVSGSTLSPGNSPGTLNTGSMTWVTGANYNWQATNLTSSTPSGSNFDSLNITGVLDVQAGFNFNLWSLSSTGPDVNGDAGGFVNNVNGFWKVASATSLTNGANLSSAVLNVSAANGTAGFSNTLAGGSFSLVLGTSPGAGGTANDVYLKFSSLSAAPDLAVTSVATPDIFVLQNASLATATSLVTLTNGNGNTGTLSGFTPSNAVLTATTGQSIPASPGTVNSTISLLSTAANTTAIGATVTYQTTAADANATDNVAAVNVRIGNAPLHATTSSTNFGAALIASTPISVTPYTGLASNTIGQTSTGSTVPALGTTATIFDYTNSTGTDTGVSMAWRSRTAAEASSTVPGDNGSLVAGYLVSDVVNLTGMGNAGGTGFTDTFILQMSYNEALLDGFETFGVNEGNIVIAWKNGTEWVNAVNGNSTPGGTYFANQAYNAASRSLGDYGIDPANNVVWAVLNHNSEFAVIPEPSTLVLGGLALLGFAGAGLRRRRIAKQQA